MFQINLQSSDLSKTKQIFYHRTSQSLKNKDLLSEPPKGEFDMQHFAPNLLEHSTFLEEGDVDQGQDNTEDNWKKMTLVILYNEFLKESCEYGTQHTVECFRFMNSFPVFVINLTS